MINIRNSVADNSSPCVSCDCALLNLLNQQQKQQQQLKEKDDNSEQRHADEEQLLQLTVPVPVNELDRIRILRETQVLDTAAEDCFDRYTSLARRFFHAPIALVSLVDVSRQWFKSNMGLEGTPETHRNIAFCTYTVLESTPDVFIVLNATQDMRFQANPLVTGASHIRFYAGACIRVQGVKVGSLCVIDTKPRAEFTAAQAAILKELADMVTILMEDRRHRVLKAEEELAKMTLTVLYAIKQPLQDLNARNEAMQSHFRAVTKGQVVSANSNALPAKEKEVLQSHVATLEMQSKIFMTLLDLSLQVAHGLLDCNTKGVTDLAPCKLTSVAEKTGQLLDQMAALCPKSVKYLEKCKQFEQESEGQQRQLYSHPEVLVLLMVTMVIFVQQTDTKMMQEEQHGDKSQIGFEARLSPVAGADNQRIKHNKGELFFSFCIGYNKLQGISTDQSGLLGLQQVLHYIGGIIEVKQSTDNNDITFVVVKVPCVSISKTSKVQPATPPMTMNAENVQEAIEQLRNTMEVRVEEMRGRSMSEEDKAVAALSSKKPSAESGALHSSTTVWGIMLGRLSRFYSDASRQEEGTVQKAKEKKPLSTLFSNNKVHPTNISDATMMPDDCTIGHVSPVLSGRSDTSDLTTEVY